MMNDMVAELVMTAIEDTKVNLTTTLEQTIEETTQKVTNMMKVETNIIQRLIKDVKENILPQFIEDQTDKLDSFTTEQAQIF